MAAYFLAIGDHTTAQRLRDCRSDQIELAEVEAEEEWKARWERGDTKSIIRVVEANTHQVVYAVGRKSHRCTGEGQVRQRGSAVVPDLRQRCDTPTNWH